MQLKIFHDGVIIWKQFPRKWPFVWGESTGHRWIPLTKASDAELWCFLWLAPEQTVEQTVEKPMIWDTIALIETSLQRVVFRCGEVSPDIIHIL